MVLRSNLLLVLVAGIIIASTACGGGGNSPASSPPPSGAVGVSVSPSSADALLGNTQQFNDRKSGWGGIALGKFAV